MRFAALTSMRGAGQSLAWQAGVRTHSRNGAPALPRAKPSSRFPWRSGMICLAALSLLHACLHFNETGQTLSPSASPVAAPLPAWIEILRPREIFHLETPEFAGGAELYVARRHRTGGGRQDIWEFGGLSEAAPLLNLLIYQPGTEAAPDASFYVELARRAAETGRAIIRAEQPVEITTKFGAFEIARLGLARDGASPRKCLGFRFDNAAPSLHVTGFACGGGEMLASPLTWPLESKAALACLIDRIDLAPDAEDKGLIDFFAAHYAIRSPNCPGPEIDPVPVRPARLLKTSEAAQTKRQGASRQR
jgi:hypothetical protein